MQIENFIGGKFIAPLNGDYLENHNPATGNVTSHIPNSTADDIAEAVQAAQDALPAWSALSLSERIEWLGKLLKH